MPTYTYNGQATYVNQSYYNLHVEPGESFTTSYLLPANWTDFTLTDADTPPAITPHTETVAVPSTVDVAGYAKITLVNTVPGSVAGIKLGNTTQTDVLELNDTEPMTLEISYPVNIDEIYLTVVSGVPSVDITFEFGI